MFSRYTRAILRACSFSFLLLGISRASGGGEIPSFIIRADWPVEAQSQTWLIVAAPGASPKVAIRDFRLVAAERPMAGTNEEPEIPGQPKESKSLPSPEREILTNEINSMLTIRDEGQMRFWRLHRVEFSPRLLSRDQSQYRIDWAEVEVSQLGAATEDAEALRRANLEAGWGYGTVMPLIVANPAQLSLTVDPAPLEAIESADASWSPTAFSPESKIFEFHVNEDRPLRILPQHFAERGVDPGQIDPARISLVCQGETIPAILNADADGAFEPGESIVFYGLKSDSRFTVDRAYWLAAGPGESLLRMLEAPAIEPRDAAVRDWHMATLRIEEDNFYETEMSDFLNIRDFRWVWSTLSTDTATTFTFDLPQLFPAGVDEDAPLTLDLNFFHTPDEFSSGRILKFELNNRAMPDMGFTEAKDAVKTYSVPAGWLKPKDNFARLSFATAPGVADGGGAHDISHGSHFDSLVLTYPMKNVAENDAVDITVAAKDSDTTQTFTIAGFTPGADLTLLDVSDPRAVRRLAAKPDRTGTLAFTSAQNTRRRLMALATDDITSAPLLRAFRGAHLRGPEHEADYLIVAPEKFKAGLAPLVEAKRREGMRVEVVEAEDVFDEFDAGHKTPQAIKRLLRHAVNEWKTPPTYVLLVGDSTSDYRGEMREKVENILPSYRSEQPQGGDTWASEDWFATFSGEDDYQDIILGRLSVNNVDDLGETVRKAVAVSDGLPLGPWRNRITLVSGGEAEFVDASESVRKDFIPPEWFVDKLYVSDFALQRNFYFDEAEVLRENMKVSSDATQAILNAFDRGTNIILFSGHGSPNIWTNERVWLGGGTQNSDNLLLRNTPFWPFVANFTCNTGAIDYPQPPWNVTITEDMMRVKRGGARSLYVPSGPGVTGTHIEVAREMLHALLRDELPRQGDALLLSESRYLTRRDRSADYTRMFHLMGDPAAVFPEPRETARLEATPVEQGPEAGSIAASIADAPFPNGKAVFRIENPAGDVASESVALDFAPGTMRFLIPFKSGNVEGLWSLKAYLWNDELKREAHGMTPFVLGTAYASIDDFQAACEDGATTFALNLRNPSLRPIQGLRFEIRRRDGALWRPLAAASVDLAPGQSTVWTQNWTAPFGLHELEARLVNFERAPVEAGGVSVRKTRTIANPDPNGPLRFAMTTSDLERTFLQATREEMQMEARFHVYVESGKYEGPVSAGWGFAQDAMTTTTVQIPGENSWESNVAVFVLKTPAAELRREGAAFRSKPFTLYASAAEDAALENTEAGDDSAAASAGRSGSTAPSGAAGRSGAGAARLVSSIDPNLLPDLVFDGGVTINPTAPTDGGTTWFRVGIRNAGGGPAPEFRIAGYDKHPDQGGSELPNLMGPSYVAVKNLDPGERTEAVIRWDPKENAGDREVYFKLDALENVLERDEANVADVPVKVRTLSKLEQPKLSMQVIPAREAGKLAVRINIQIANKGETAARNVTFAFFREREPRPEYKLGEVLAPVIEAGATYTEHFDWQLPAEYDKYVNTNEIFKVSVNGQIYLRGSLQRINVAPDE